MFLGYVRRSLIPKVSMPALEVDDRETSSQYSSTNSSDHNCTDPSRSFNPSSVLAHSLSRPAALRLYSPRSRIPAEWIDNMKALEPCVATLYYLSDALLSATSFAASLLPLLLVAASSTTAGYTFLCY